MATIPLILLCCAVLQYYRYLVVRPVHSLDFSRTETAKYEKPTQRTSPQVIFVGGKRKRSEQNKNNVTAQDNFPECVTRGSVNSVRVKAGEGLGSE